jgi:hypothetical protein
MRLLILEAMKKGQQVSGGVKTVYKGGTKAVRRVSRTLFCGSSLMGINLTTIKHDAFARRPAKTRYSNGWLSFENQACDLLSRPGAIPLGIIK